MNPLFSVEGLHVVNCVPQEIGKLECDLLNKGFTLLEVKNVEEGLVYIMYYNKSKPLVVDRCHLEETIKALQLFNVYILKGTLIKGREEYEITVERRDETSAHPPLNLKRVTPLRRSTKVESLFKRRKGYLLLN
ncbi:hypothetical protein [Criblamydia sequanensis]|uniref:Uncharacterized protein n=1 Tax=Candidatus Criblamydia sequanensis CRIB-18 TaxID=1437425 RepID=A0A090CXX1_9BACT|nr:hypothetical protein [Criblamydia sequanensis]CDR32936.1 hypothetical protein CSEC_0092 [Criblamydia sequanensis CRIB-18]